MTEKDQKNTNTSENTDKTPEVAPYMISKKEAEHEASSSAGIIIPIILSFVLAVIVVVSFFEDEYKAVIANLTTDTEIATAAVEKTPSNMTNSAIEPLEMEPPMEVAAASPAISNTTTASTQTTSQPGLITVYNPYLRPYPQVYAPIYQQPQPYRYLTPYSMPSQQANSYNEMMQNRQKMIDEMHKMRNAAIQRMEKNRQELQQKMKQRRAETQKAHAEILKKAREARIYHPI